MHQQRTFGILLVAALRVLFENNKSLILNTAKVSQFLYSKIYFPPFCYLKKLFFPKYFLEPSDKKVVFNIAYLRYKFFSNLQFAPV